MRNFEFYRPQNIGEAFDLLEYHKEKSRIWAGGTDLLIRLRDQAFKIGALIDLKQIPQLDMINFDENTGLRLGALVRIRDIETSNILREKYPILVQAAETLGSIQVRNKATVGGNICNASPSADMVPSLIALGAEVKIAGKNKEKVLPLGELFKSPGKTALESGEILTEISIPHMVPHSCGVYLKQGRRKALDLAVAGVASVATIDPTHSKCVDIRIVLGAVAPTAIRAKKAEAIMRGSNLSDPIVNEAAKVAAGECSPIDDVRSSAWYRRQVVEVLVKRSIMQAINKVKAGEEKIT